MTKRLLLFTIILTAIVYACNTQPTQPSSDKPSTSSSLILNPVPVPLDQNAHLFNLKGGVTEESLYAMNFSTLAHTDFEDPYLYQRFEIEFSDDILSDSNGKTRTLKYAYSIPTQYARKDARLDSDQNVIIRVVNERIPDSDKAEDLLRNATNVFKPGSNLHQLLAENSNIDFSEYEDEDIVIVPQGTPCTVIIEPPSCYTQYFDGGESSFTQCFFKACSSSSIDDPPPYTPLPPPDLPPNPDPGDGGGSNPPPGGSGGEDDICNDPTLIMYPPECQQEEEEEPEPCETGNEVVDNPPFQNVLEGIFTDALYTNGDLIPTAERDEVMGVVLQTANGFEFIPFTAQEVSSCHMRGVGIAVPPSQYGDVVAMVHIHPFMPGTEIEDQRCIDARPGFIPGSTYGSLPSPADRAAFASFNLTLRDDGFSNVPMVVLDEDKISILNDYNDGDNQSNSAIYNNPHDRCGY